MFQNEDNMPSFCIDYYHGSENDCEVSPRPAFASEIGFPPRVGETITFVNNDPPQYHKKFMVTQVNYHKLIRKPRMQFVGNELYTPDDDAPLNASGTMVSVYLMLINQSDWLDKKEDLEEENE